MCACAMPSTPTSRSDFEYFQRKKVGSIRDNPKLLKIRQRFENASQNSPNTKSSYPDSAPSSISISKRTGSGVLEELLKANSSYSDKTDAFLKSQLGFRRHSEGEADNRTSLSVFTSKERTNEKNSSSVYNLNKTDERRGLSHDLKTNIKFVSDKKSDSGSRLKNSGSCSTRSLNDTSFMQLKNTLSSTIPKAPKRIDNKVQIFENIDAAAPPIPKRGISPAVKKNLVSPLSLNSSQNESTPSPTELSSNRIKSSPVRKTIQMYEGMSSGDSKKIRTKYSTSSQRSAKKDLSSGSFRSSGISRRSSRRNSLRKSRTFTDAKTEKNDSIPASKRTSSEECCSKEDSGLGSSDAEDKTQAVYQTLSTVVRDRDDPYDRLNRVHDVVARVHKGQISSCAACKTLPPSIMQWPHEETSFLRIKCHEVTPHHHPPCICFSCSHSVFSCVLDVEVPPPEEDNLYSNVCCLNSPDRESWRQSRRRPVCERNGRLCVVNCDIEQRQMETCYDRLCEWNTPSDECPSQKRPPKTISGDSCDSDEGWVDVTDSEDEKNIASSERLPPVQSEETDNNLYRNLDRYLSIQNSAYDINSLISKCVELDLSRCSSTEHLYETIADVEAHNVNNNLKETPDCSSTLSLKSEPPPENDLDSGEWSTESASPTFDESTTKHEHQPKSSDGSYQNRFVVHLESQETAKLNFMKSVLGKKAPTTKRRMSNFFVPWLVMNEYNSPSTRSHKTVAKKKSGCYPTSSKTSPRKAKRSQSTSANSPENSRTSEVSFHSVDNLEKYKNKSPASENESRKMMDNLCLPADMSSRASVASSAYIRADELQTPGSVKESPVVSADAPPIEVSVERICRTSSDGTSEHSYILFQPVKEEDVPLYQFYERNVKERVSFCCSSNSLSPVFGTSSIENGSTMDAGIKPQLSVVEQLSPDTQDMKMLWCELPEATHQKNSEEHSRRPTPSFEPLFMQKVKESGILERISAQELKLQEAAFEFIQSQASFIRSLKVLYENFIRMPEFSDPESYESCVLSKHEHDVLFSDIVRVKEVGENLLSELTIRWSDGILIPDICDIIHRHATLPSFSVYVRYCSNRVYQERTLKELKETRLCFLEVLRKLESNPVCQGLSLESFLFLPMQHIARLPLLLDNIFRWLTPESPTYCTCKLALEAVHKIFVECNDGARKMERLEEMFVLNKQLEFKECKALPLISASRWLLKKGELLKLEFDKKTFGRSSRCVRVPVYIFLFNDLLVVTKRKSEDCYLVVDYCSREKVQAMVVNAQDLQHPMVVPNTCRYLIYLTLFNNHQGNTVDMILSCALLSERTRWIEAIHTVPENKPCEVWEYDCPQVQCVRSYIAQQPDELSLQESDVITIHRKMNDGWYEGRRLRDGLQGWFPASYTMDIPCSRARASNLRQCYRLLMLSHKQ